MTADTRYRAFLSYSRSDERAARALHRALERFPARALPSSVRAESARPLKPVFRDRDELSASGDLSRTLEAALLASDALVVVCSPAAAASRWVNEEVLAFKRAGRSDRVFAAIVAGDPALPGFCFPPALCAEYDASGSPTGRQIEPLAVDLRTEPRVAKLRLVAALLGVEFDQLRSRERILRREQLAWRGLSAVALVTMAAGITWFASRPTPCLDTASLAASLWGETQERRIATAFAATSEPYAEDAFRFVRARLERWVSEWASAHADTCAATRVRKEQSERLHDLRMACLAESRRRFEAFTAELETADARVVERAVDSLELLTAVARCADREALEARYPPPEDPDVAKRVDALFELLAGARAALAAGRIASAREIVEGLVADAAATGYAPLEAAALLVRAEAQRDAGEIRAARETYFQAAAKAVLARDPELAASAWLGLPLALAQGDANFEEAMTLARLAESYLDQLGKDHPLRARFHFTVGSVAVLAGRFAEGIDALESAVDRARTAEDANLPQYLGALSWALVGVNELARAGTLAEESVDLTGQRFGTRHPRYAASLVDLSRVEMRLGHSADAAAHLQHAVDIYAEIYPEGHSVLAAAFEQLAWLLKEIGRYEDASQQANRALALLARMEQPNWAVSGSIHNALGDVYLDLKQYDAARIELERALEDWSKLGEHPNVGIALNNLGNLDNRQGRFRDAHDRCTDALKRDEQFYGTDNAQLAYPLSCLGEAQIGLGDTGAAVASLERAYRLRDRPDIDRGRRAWSEWLLGRAVWEAGDRARARELVAAARAVIAGLDDATAELEEIDAWISEKGIALD